MFWSPNHRQSPFSFWVLRQKPTNRCESRIFEVSISQFLIVSCKSMNFQNMTHTILGELSDGLGPNHHQSSFSFWVLRQKPTNRCESRIFDVSISQFLIVSCKSMDFQNMTHTILGEPSDGLGPNHRQSPFFILGSSPETYKSL